MGKVNKISDKSFAESSAYEFGKKWAKSLEPSLKAGDELNVVLKRMSKNYELLKKQTKGFIYLEKQFKIAPTRKEFVKLKNKEIKLVEENQVALKEQQRLEKSLISVIQKKQLAVESTNKALTKNKYELNKLNKIEKENAVLNSKSSTLIEKLNVKRLQSIRVIQDLIAKRETGIKLSKNEELTLKKARDQFYRYDKAIKTAKTSTYQFQEYVGRYPTTFKLAMASVKQFIPLITGGFGFMQGIQVVKGAIQITRDFGKTMSNIAGIYRKNRKDIEPLEEKIVAVAGASVNTATDVAKLAESLATLGKKEVDIIKLLEPANSLAIGLNASADASGEFLVQMLNAFNASSDEASKYADVIATIRTSTSLDFQKMVDSFQYLAPISKALNKDIAYTGSLIGILSDNAIKAERAGRLLGTAQQRLAKENLTLIDGLDLLNEAKKKNVSELELLKLASDLFGKQAAALGVVLADNTELIEKNAEAIRNNGGALNDLVDEQLTSLDAHFRILESRWEEYILNTDKSTGASNDLKKALKFLSDNLGTIINVSIKVVKWIGIYKVTMALSSSVTKIATKSNKLYRLSIIAMNGGIKKAIISLRALKIATGATGVGLFLVALGAAYEIWQSFSDGAKEAVDEVTKLNNEMERFNKIQSRYKEIVSTYKKGTEQIGASIEGQENILKRVGEKLKEYADQNYQSNEIHIREAKKLIKNTHETEIEKIKEKISVASTYSERQIKYIIGEIAAYQSLEKTIKENENYLDEIEKEKRRKEEERRKKQEAIKKQAIKDSYSLNRYKLEQSIEVEKNILESSKSSYKKRLIANQQYIDKSISLLRVQSRKAIEEAKGRTDKIKEIKLKFEADKEAIEKQGEENSLNILRSYFELRKSILEKIKGSNDGELTLKLNVKQEKLNDVLGDDTLPLKRKEELIEKHEKNIANIKRKFAKEALKQQIAFLEVELQNEKYNQEQKGKIANTLKGLKLSLSRVVTEGITEDLKDQKQKEQEFHEWKTNQILLASENLSLSLNIDSAKIESFLTQMVDGFGKSTEGVLNGITTMTGIVGGVMSGIYQANIQQIEDERQYWDEYYDKRIENAEGDKIHQDLLRKEKKKKDDELNKKQRKEQHKQAKFQRDAAIFQIGINTAQAILGIWAQVPKFDFGISAGLLTALVSSLGLAQMAAVASKPLPKYAKGTDNHSGGLALVGEERPEVIIEPNKDPYITFTPSIIDLPSGTKVVPSLEEYEKIMRSSSMASLDIENRKLKSYQEQQRSLDSFLMAELLEETRLSRKAFERSRPIHINDNSEKIADSISQAIYKQNATDWD